MFLRLASGMQWLGHQPMNGLVGIGLAFSTGSNPGQMGDEFM